MTGSMSKAKALGAGTEELGVLSFQSSVGREGVGSWQLVLRKGAVCRFKSLPTDDGWLTTDHFLF